MKSILPFLEKALPLGIAVKGLTSLDPRIQGFLAASTAAGYGVDKAIDYMRDLFDTDPSKRRKMELEQRAQQGTILPHEEQTLTNVSPSKGAKIAQGVASIAGGLGSGALSNKLMKGAATEIISSPKGSTLKKKEIGHQERKGIEFKEPAPKKVSPIPPDLEERIRFHMDKSGLSIDDAVEVEAAIDPSKKKMIKDLKKKGAFSNFEGSQPNPSTTDSKQSNSNPSEGDLAELINKLAAMLENG